MKRTVAVLGGLLLTAGLVITGCNRGNNTTSPDDSSQAPVGVTNEQSAMQYFAAIDEFVTNDERAFADNLMAPTDYNDAFQKTDAAIAPLRWGRFITSVSRTTTVVAANDTMSVVHVTRVVSGTLKIRTTIGGADTTIAKALTDTSGRNVIFRRVARDSRRFWLNWMPVATTLVNGMTSPQPAGSAIMITQVMIRGGSDTITITDPEGTWLRYKWLNIFHGGRADVPQLVAGDSIFVTATVKSQAADTDLVVLRHGFGSPRFGRARMTLISQTGPDVDGFYTRIYQKHIQPRLGLGSLNVGVDAMTRATLYDDVAPYSVSWWGIPYRMM